MKIKNILLGLLEGLIVFLVIFFLFSLNEKDLHIPGQAFIIAVLLLVSCAMMVLSNNAHKLLLKQDFVPKADRVFEVVVGAATFVSLFFLYL